MTGETIEVLIQKAEALPDPESRRVALDLVQAVMDLHASGLERALEVLWAREDGQRAIDVLGQDPTVSNLLILHDLHPLDLEARARRALDRPEFSSANVQLISAAHEFVRVRMNGGPDLRAAVETALMEAAPDAAGIEIEQSVVKEGFVPLAALVGN